MDTLALPWPILFLEFFIREVTFQGKGKGLVNDEDIILATASKSVRCQDTRYTCEILFITRDHLIAMLLSRGENDSVW